MLPHLYRETVQCHRRERQTEIRDLDPKNVLGQVKDEMRETSETRTE